MKILLRIGLGLLVLIVLALGAVVVFLDPLIVRVVEAGATYGTGVETKLGAADAGLVSGKLDLDEFTIANPPGFRAEPFFRLGAARALWSNRSLFSDTIRVEELVLDGVTLELERSDKGTNWSVILDNLEKLSSKKAPAPAAEPGAGKTLSVGRIQIRNIHAALHLAGLPLGTGSYAVDVPRVSIDQFRTDGTMSEVIAKLTATLIQAILDAAVTGGQNILPKDVLADLDGRLDDLRGTLEKQVGTALEGADRDIEKRAQELQKKLDEQLKGVGGLFDKKKN